MAGDDFQGMSIPAGDPDGVAQAATGFSSVAAGTAVAATRLEAMPTMVGSWVGGASVAHASMCLTNAGAARQAAEAATIVVRAAERYAEELRDARRDARHAIRDAREAQHRIDEAKADMADAQGRLADANRRIDAASHILALSSVGGHPSAAAEADLSAASADAERAAEDERRARRELKRAQDDLDDAKRRWHKADEAARDAARAAATGFSHAAAMLPSWVAPPPPAEPPPQDDRSWWEKAADVAWDQTKGLGKGAREGVKGLGDAAAMGYRASPLNAVVDPDGFARQWSQLGQGAMYAYHHPGDFAKMAINYDDLSHGRIGEWLGNLAPDAALAIGTAGAGTIASRSARVAKVIEKGAEIPSTVRKIGGRNPINARYAGKKFPLSPELSAQYPKGVTFRETGFPAFTPYRQAHAEISGLTGDVRIDGRIANQATSLPRTPEGWTWHHVEDGRTMELIPRDLHGYVRHTGGAAAIRHGQVGEIPVVKVPKAWSWGTGATVGAGSELFGQAPARAGAGP
jgi:A nuclease of the HNH/ENDO VII superfamily with conserved WHH